MNDKKELDPSVPLDNPRHERVAQEVANGSSYGNALLAAGYSAKSCKTNVTRLTKNYSVNARIAYLKARMAESTIMTGSQILNELSMRAMVKISDILNEDGSLKRMSEIPDHVQRCVASMDLKDGKFRLLDSYKALELLGKHLKLFVDRTEHNGEITHTVSVKHERIG
jgi:phage terminase small subunit